VIKLFYRLSIVFVLGACASDEYVETHGHTMFRRGEYAYAEEDFAKSGQKPGPNQFLYVVDAGMSAFRSGQFAKAIDHFLKAEKNCRD
jgi:Flp pilus assembly protein TadD